jgi:hypothetical protein
MPATSKHVTDSEALLRAVDCLLGAVNAEKHWGDDFYQDWNPIITALTSELLLSCGLSPDTPWYVKRLKYARHTLEDSLKWLDGKIGADGTFGTDFWDATRLAIFIEREKLYRYFPSYERLKAYLLNCICTNALLSGNSIWSGPGFLAAATDYLDLLGTAAESDIVIQRIITCQQSDGSWQGNFGPDGHPLVSPVWHTAQVVWTLSRRGASEHRARINKSIAWLKSVQTEEGYWGGQQQFIIYFTSYALTALLCAEKPEKEAITRAVEFLKSKMTPDGKCSDMGGTLLCAFALRQIVGQHFQHNLTVADYVLSRNNAVRAEAAESAHSVKENELNEAREKLQKVETDYRRLAEKYADGEIVISKRAAFAFAILFTIIIPTVSEIVKYWITKPKTSESAATNPVLQPVTKTNLVTITNFVVPPAQPTTNKNP